MRKQSSVIHSNGTKKRCHLAQNGERFYEFRAAGLEENVKLKGDISLMVGGKNKNSGNWGKNVDGKLDEREPKIMLEGNGTLVVHCEPVRPQYLWGDPGNSQYQMAQVASHS